ncbi:reverse transcriptase [Tanacetum coccineum]|uniref:Reverse transcriptase n=1 Tax=Tanacetum coccineum TaxID=301880 RepID=A0ABQ5G1P2_9ASTR
MGCYIRSTCPLFVTVGDGYNIATTSECKQFHWKLQGVDFCSNVMLLPLSGCEMVLGIQWLSIMGDIKCNFKDLRMEFGYKNKKMVLRGTLKPCDHRIPLLEGTTIVNVRPYKHPLTRKDAIESMVKELLDTSVIRPIRAYKSMWDIKEGVGSNKATSIICKTEPLTLILKKNGFKWNAESQKAFEQLKQAMMSAPILALLNFEKGFIMETDALGVAIGGSFDTRRTSYSIPQQDPVSKTPIDVYL